MDGIGGLIVVVIIWIIGSVFEQKKKQEQRRRQARQVPPPAVDVEPVSAEPRSGRPDPSQREGSRLEQVLRELNPELADLAEQASRASRKQPQARRRTYSERPARRAERPPVIAAEETKSDFVAKAEAAIARRRQVAAEHIRDRTDQDHESFHRLARREMTASVHPAAVPPSLQQAIIWREILGPPKALTIDEY